MIVDTSALLAFFDLDEPAHESVTELLTSTNEPLIVSPYVIAELDYLVTSRLGVAAELAVLRELAGGSWELPAITTTELAEIASVIDRYADQVIGAADGSNVILAKRYRTSTIATLDHRHFDMLRTLSGEPFVVLP